jgi:hypothetical protein
MQEIFKRLCLRTIAELLTDQVLDRLDVVIGRRLDCLDAFRVVQRKVVDDAVQHVFHD